MLSPLNIVFHKGKTPIALLIRLFTKSSYSHCALVIDNFHLVQLDWKTPTSIKHLEYPIGDYDVYELITEVTEDEQEKIRQFIRKYISTTYDWKFIFSRFFNILFGTSIVNSKGLYNCDELIVDAFRSVSINLIGDEKLTPDSLSKSKLLRLKKK